MSKIFYILKILGILSNVLQGPFTSWRIFRRIFLGFKELLKTSKAFEQYSRERGSRGKTPGPVNILLLQNNIQKAVCWTFIR